MSAVHRVAVLNRSTIVNDDELIAWVAALNKHAAATFSQDWSLPLLFSAVTKRDTTSWQGQDNIVMLDTSDEANALGYHQSTPEGKALAKVFARTCYDDGASITVCLAHEAYELAVDPYCQLMAPGRDGKLYAFEVCDPVEADNLGDHVDGVLLSDYVLPRWFDPLAKGGKFDHKHVLTKPGTLARGGYLSRTDRWPATWQQVFGDVNVDGVAVEEAEVVSAGAEAAIIGRHADRELTRRIAYEDRRQSVA